MFICGSYLYSRYKRYYHKIDFEEIVEKDRLDSETRIPFVVKNKLERFKNWTIDFFRENYGDELIYVLNSENKECTVSESRLLKMQLGEYIDDYIRGKHPHKKNIISEARTTTNSSRMWDSIKQLRRSSRIKSRGIYF